MVSGSADFALPQVERLCREVPSRSSHQAFLFWGSFVLDTVWRDRRSRLLSTSHDSWWRVRKNCSFFVWTLTHVFSTCTDFRLGTFTCLVLSRHFQRISTRAMRRELIPLYARGYTLAPFLNLLIWLNVLVFFQYVVNFSILRMPSHLSYWFGRIWSPP